MKYFNVLLALILVLVTMSCSKNTGVKRVSVSENRVTVDAVTTRKNNQGVRYLKERKFTQAEAVFRELSAMHRSLVSPMLNLALVYIKQDRFLEAESILRKALERNSYRAETYNLLGVVLRRQGRFKDAESSYRYAIQVNANYAKAYLNLAVLYDLYLNQPQNAQKHYQRYVALSPESSAQAKSWLVDLQKRAQVSNE